MRIRSIKPEFWRSDDITALDWETRLVFIGLWSYVDDNGVGKDRLASIVGDLFAGDLEADIRDTFATVSRALQTLAELGLIVRYEFDGKRWLYVAKWPDHQKIDRPAQPRFPLPDGRIATPSREGSEGASTGSGDQGIRGSVSRALEVLGEDGLTKIEAITGGGPTHARQAAVKILTRASGDVKAPLRYCLKAIEAEPELFVRKKGAPKRHQECPIHPGQHADNCGGCAADARAVS